MHIQELREEMEHFYSYLQRILHVEHLAIPSRNYDLVLDIHHAESEDKKAYWSYYYACHETRCLFWLHEYPIFEPDGFESPAHISALQSLQVSPSVT
jgi:hypothetical protein